MANIIVIRLRGTLNVPPKYKDTLKMLKLDHVNSARLIDSENSSLMGMVRKVKDFVTFGELNQETEKELKQKRKLNEYNVVKLHPPVKGLRNIKISYPKGDLGYRGDEINKLVKRMM